ncbi:MAG: hypothetical protein QOJ65_1143 [Fimbriimonadaceae bacterium]|jgi:hypothetical protein|nr:hypothetical protein [Fimbriimonadaceae bacterium]
MRLRASAFSAPPREIPKLNLGENRDQCPPKSAIPWSKDNRMNRRHLALGFALLCTAAAAILFAAQDHNHPDLSFARKSFQSYTIQKDGLIYRDEWYDFGNAPKESWLPKIEHAAAEAGLTLYKPANLAGLTHALPDMYCYHDVLGRRALTLTFYEQAPPSLVYQVQPVSAVQGIVGLFLMRLSGRSRTTTVEVGKANEIMVSQNFGLEEQDR